MHNYMKIMLDFCQKSVNFTVIRTVGLMVYLWYFPGKTGNVGKSALYCNPNEGNRY